MLKQVAWGYAFAGLFTMGASHSSSTRHHDWLKEQLNIDEWDMTKLRLAESTFAGIVWPVAAFHLAIRKHSLEWDRAKWSEERTKQYVHEWAEMRDLMGCKSRSDFNRWINNESEDKKE